MEGRSATEKVGVITVYATKAGNRDGTALGNAKAGQEAYDKEALGFPKSTGGGSRVDFTTRNGWPGWDDIIDNLEKKSVDKTP